MDYDLFVTAPFGAYRIGDRISDAATIAAVLATPNAAFVVRAAHASDGGSPGPVRPALGESAAFTLSVGGVLWPYTLADLADAIITLALGTSATRDVGTGAEQVAAGDDARITGAVQQTGLSSAILAALASLPTVRDGLAVGDWWLNDGTPTRVTSL